MSTALANTAEGGTSGATPTSSDTGSGDPWDAVTVNTGHTITYDTTQHWHGSKSYKFTTGTTAATTELKWNTSLTNASQGFARVYIRLAAYPTVTVVPVRWVDGTGSTVASLRVSNAGALSFNDGSGIQQLVCSTHIPLNTWARIDGSVVSSATAGVGSISLFLTDPDSSTADEAHTSSASLSTNGAQIAEAWFGCTATATTGSISFWLDDPAVSTLSDPGSSSAITAPGAPTGVTAVAGDSSVTVPYTEGSTGGGTLTDTVTPFIAGVAQPSLAVTGSPSGTRVGGLTNGTAYTFKVTSVNAAGSATSAASSPVTPTAGTFLFHCGFIPESAGAIVTPPPSLIINGMAPGTSPSLQGAWNQFAVPYGITAIRSYDNSQPASFASSSAGAISGPLTRLISVNTAYTVSPTSAQKAAVTGWAATVPNGTRVVNHHEPENDGTTPAIWAGTCLWWQNAVRAGNPTLLTGVITVANSSASASYLAAAVSAGLTPDFYYCDGYSGIPPSSNPPYPSPSTVFAHYLTLHSTYFPAALKGVGEWGQNNKIGDRSPYLIAFYSYAVKNGFSEVYYFQALTPWTLTTTKELTTLGGLG
jgi:hypothetical protein